MDMHPSQISPVPSDDEAVAIIVAVEAMWPRAVVIIDDQPTRRDTSWRFSGRWWAKPVPARRGRPFV